MSLKQLETRIKKIEQRNTQVEANKIWETSWTRRILISLLTYLVIGIYLTVVIKLPNPWINALVPTLGFILSTLSLQVIKNIWIKFLKK